MKKPKNIVIIYFFILFIVAKEQEFLIKQSRSSFGKMILADFKTNPKYSIGKAKRKPLYESTIAPGPKYSTSNSGDLKFSKPPQWKIGDALRPGLYTNERYDYYNHPYDKETDLGALPKKWDKIPGGASCLAPKMIYDFNEKTPGPGRYEPKFEIQKKKMPSYYLGLKLKGNSVSLQTGTGINVAPWSYNQDNVTSLSQHREFPVYSFQKDKRKPLGDKVWTKNESYFVYSSMGNQVMAQKPTMPVESFTKSTRETRSKCGMFNSMLENQPTKISIPMPKF